MASVMKKCFFLSRLLKYSVNELTVIKQSRHLSTKSSKLMYSEYGDPIKVVHRTDEVWDSKLKDNEVLVKMIASPVNPADINTIQGKYPVKPPLPSIPGNEGVGEVLSLGKHVQNFAVGDRVVLLTGAMGTWRTHIVIQNNFLFKIPKKLGVVEAATLTVNPCTAYRMLRDFVPLKPGDTVIQNGGNSSAGQNVIQIARVWGIKTVSIVRDRPNIAELKEFLHTLGANYVFTEEELRTTRLFKNGNVNRPKLALNCVGGKSSLEMIRHLAQSATLVTYGGMSREPVTVPTGHLIFKDLKLRGFWMTAWSQDHTETPERKEMFDEIISMMTNGEIHGPAYTMVPFDKFQEALLNTMTIAGMIGRKFILDFTKP